jgi:hypothetical protein
MYLIALSSCPFPCLATFSSALLLVALAGVLRCDDWPAPPAEERREGKERSVEEEEKVCANQPERRVGMSFILAEELGELGGDSVRLPPLLLGSTMTGGFDPPGAFWSPLLPVA